MMNARREVCTHMLQLIALFTVVISEINLTCGQSYNQVFMDGNNGNTGCNTQTSSYMRDGKIIQTVTIRGCGMNDHFEFEVPPTFGRTSVTNSNNRLIVGDPNSDVFFLYSDTPATLVVMRGGSCVRKTYTTDSQGRSSSTTTPMSDAECDAVRQSALEEIERNRVYWENWNKDFQENMKKTFPPGFPFHGQHRENNERDNDWNFENDGNDYGYSASNENENQTPNFFGGVGNLGRSMGNFGRKIQENLAKTMGDVFRVGFPFNR